MPPDFITENDRFIISSYRRKIARELKILRELKESLARLENYYGPELMGEFDKTTNEKGESI